MKLKYNHNGQTEAVEFSTYNHPKPRVAISHAGETWYVPRVAADDNDASTFKFCYNDEVCALQTNATVPPVVFSNPNNPKQSYGVTLYSDKFGDFGVLGDSLGSDDPGPGTEYYTQLTLLTAMSENTTLIGNKNNNVYHIRGGGRKNVITGGIGNDTVTFQSGGGLITDFGAGCVKDIDKKTLAGAPTTDGYDRTNPSTYKEGVDILKVYGTVKNIAYEGYGDNNTKKNKKFSAYVVYTADNDGKDYVIKLDNIYKSATNYSTGTYRYDDSVAGAFDIYDTSTGTLDSIKASREGLRTTINNSPYKTLINQFNSMIAT